MGYIRKNGQLIKRHEGGTPVVNSNDVDEKTTYKVEDYKKM